MMNKYYATIVCMNSYRQYVDRSIQFDAKSIKNARARILREFGNAIKSTDFTSKETYVFQLPKGEDIPKKVTIFSKEFEEKYHPIYLGFMDYWKGFPAWNVHKKAYPRVVTYRVKPDGSIIRM